MLKHMQSAHRCLVLMPERRPPAGRGPKARPPQGRPGPPASLWRVASARSAPIGWRALFAGLLAVAQVYADFHVAPTGSDLNPGTASRPFASLEQARDALRALKRNGNLPPNGFSIWLHGGDYLRTNTLELTAEDSGTPTAPICWRAAPNEKPRLSGGRILSGFTPVTDSTTLNRLNASARPHVLQLDLRAIGIANLGEMHSRGFGRATVPSHPELFCGDRPMTLARWPNEGEFALIAGYPASAGRDDGHGTLLGELADGFHYEGDRPRRWSDTGDLWVHGYWA